MENASVTKIFDNTAISAFINEIPTVGILAVCSKYYALTTSIEVYYEALEGSEQEKIDTCFTDIQIVDKNPEKLYKDLMRELSDRYPYLHKGDISSFLLAYMDYAAEGKPYYFVTDDKTLRKRIPDLLTSNGLSSLTKKGIHKFNVTGIIGLMRHIADNGDLSESDIELIIADLKQSTFYVTEDLLSYLRSGTQ